MANIWDIITSGMGFGSYPAQGVTRTSLSPATPWQSRATGSIGSSLKMPDPGSLQSILEELQRLQDPGRYAMDPELLRRQAEAGASAQYDPIIAALRQQAATAQGRANRNVQQLGSMYSGLSNSLMSEVAPMQQRFADTQTKTDAQYQDLQDRIKSQYAQSQAEQEAMMQRLNIQAAAPDALKGQQDDLNMLVSNAASEGQNVHSQLEQQGQGAVNYTQQGAQLARTEGTNRQADLMAALADALSGIEGQIGSASAARSSAVQGNLASLMQDSQKSAVENAQRDFENYLKVLGVSQSFNKQGQGSVKSPADIGPRSMSLGLDANGAQRVQNAFMAAISNDPLIVTGIDPTSKLKLTNEALARQVVDIGRQQGLSTSELNALQNIALEYFRG